MPILVRLGIVPQDKPVGLYPARLGPIGACCEWLNSRGTLRESIYPQHGPNSPSPAVHCPLPP
ncbi:MAG: hypothetical protein ACJA0P_004434 [Planctomycetota bacterium]